MGAAESGATFKIYPAEAAMEIHRLPWHWTPTGRVTLRLREIAGPQHDESLRLSLTDDGEGGTFVSDRRSGGNPGPLECVLEQSEDGVNWAAAATLFAQGRS